MRFLDKEFGSPLLEQVKREDDRSVFILRLKKLK